MATAAGIVLSYVIHWFPHAASVQAHNTDTLYHVLAIASVPIFVLVVTVTLYSVWQFRMRPGQELEDGPPIHGNTGLEVFWTAVPAALVIGLVAYSFVVLHDNEKRPPGPELVLTVNSRQFQWSFQYPGSLTGAQPLDTYQLYLPKGEPVLFKIQAQDVIHGFWVPSFGEQIDAVPGITTTLRVTPDRLGTYPVVCSILCGAGHSLMRTNVHVLTPAAFQSWLHGQTSSSTGTVSG
ncbi:MAG: cytochrome c oxidase subunit II [Solirubrobacteraceae bacterium]